MSDLSASPPGDALELTIGYFSRTRHHNSRLLDALAERWGVAASDIRATYYLSSHDDVTPKELAEYLGITTGAMTSMVDRLERAALATRAAHPTDRRSIVVELTDRGREAVEDALGHYRAVFTGAVPAKDLAWTADFFERLAGLLSDEAGLVAARPV